MDHSSNKTRAIDRGSVEENLAMTSSTNPDANTPGGDFAKMWYDDIKDFDFNNPGFVSRAGHFTQVVWKNSVELGKGVATYKEDNVFYTQKVVGRYFPTGNFLGKFEEKVPRL